jgi:hypothetical protein
LSENKVVRFGDCFAEKDGHSIVLYVFSYGETEADHRMLIKRLYPDELYVLYQWIKEILCEINNRRDCFGCKYEKHGFKCVLKDGALKDECRKEGYKYWQARYEL